MSWIEAHKRSLRVVTLILLLVAIIGTWSFDLLNVPAEFDCDPPNIRLEGDFCGSPSSEIQAVFLTIVGIFNMIVTPIKGEIAFIQTDFGFWAGFFVYSFFLILLLQPIFNILFMIFRGDRPRIQKFHLVVCGLNLIPTLFVVLVRFSITRFAVWGAWLYLSVMICILILEGSLLKQLRSKSTAHFNHAHFGKGTDKDVLDV